MTQPFLKWVGGKTWIVNRLHSFVPQNYTRYFEPFLGSGAVFFSIANGHPSFLSDVNADLINAFKQIRDNCPKVIDFLKGHKNTERNYYRLRSSIPKSPIEQAARFIFLNRTCYNGVYRVNFKGQFNVPYCHDRSVKIFGEDNLYMASKVLNDSVFAVCDFEEILDKVRKRDLVFLDPPYTVAHGDNGFIEYNQKLFSWRDQERLASFVDRLNSKGAYYILSNAKHESIYNLYSNLGKGFELERKNTITSCINKRGRTLEYLFTNCL
jgi:DNA adenine methylase